MQILSLRLISLGKFIVAMEFSLLWSSLYQFFYFLLFDAPLLHCIYTSYLLFVILPSYLLNTIPSLLHLYPPPFRSFPLFLFTFPPYSLTPHALILLLSLDTRLHDLHFGRLVTRSNESSMTTTVAPRRPLIPLMLIPSMAKRTRTISTRYASKLVSSNPGSNILVPRI